MAPAMRTTKTGSPTSTARCGGTSATTLCRVVGWVQEELFLKFLIKEIMVTDPTFGVIIFDIDIVRKRLPASAFDLPPKCHLEVEEVTIRIVICRVVANSWRISSLELIITKKSNS
ncbi:uncharacterized protein LOC122056281 [Zingiber officinale]|uniref:uncharacterized protein LOC122056281 n=1 Tax=Zingiber officinale TaxID=94328 RepID=UPI001C4DA95C|nr:uncharacterized protein LOC122056281 [Zingiber officinale]